MKKIISFPGQLSFEIYPKETNRCVMTLGSPIQGGVSVARMNRKTAAKLIREMRAAMRGNDNAFYALSH